MPIIMFINLKGGVAKTTNAVAIAECLAENGYKTLLIDADHQCTASELLLGEEGLLRCEWKQRTLHDLLAKMLDDNFSIAQFDHFFTKPASNIAGGLSNLSVLACSFRIDDFSTNMARGQRGYHSHDEWLRMLNHRRRQLKNWIQDNFDYAIVDCPPSIALQVKFLFPVADSYVIPSIPDRLSVRGSLFLVDRIRSHGYKIASLGTLWSLYRAQNQTHRAIIEKIGTEQVRMKLLPKPFETIIPNATAISQATELGPAPRSFDAEYSSEIAKLFERVSEEIILRSGGVPIVQYIQVPA